MILADLRTLLTRAHGAAVERLEDRTPEGVARAHLPRFLTVRDGSRCLSYHAEHALMRWSGTELIDLTDPGTVHAIKVALALALGLDPGPMGVDLSWSKRNMGGYILCSASHNWAFEASEQASIKALVLACQHVIKENA